MRRQIKVRPARHADFTPVNAQQRIPIFNATQLPAPLGVHLSCTHSLLSPRQHREPKHYAASNKQKPVTNRKMHAETYGGIVLFFERLQAMQNLFNGLRSLRGSTRLRSYRRRHPANAHSRRACRISSDDFEQTNCQAVVRNTQGRSLARSPRQLATTTTVHAVYGHGALTTLTTPLWCGTLRGSRSRSRVGIVGSGGRAIVRIVVFVVKFAAHFSALLQNSSGAKGAKPSMGSFHALSPVDSDSRCDQPSLSECRAQLEQQTKMRSQVPIIKRLTKTP